MDATTTCHTSKLDINVQSLLHNVQVNKRANGGLSLTWSDMTTIYIDQLSGVALVPTSTIGRASSTVT